MKIKILTSCTGLDYSYASGETPDVKKEIASDLIAAGHAIAVKGRNDGKGDGTPSNGEIPDENKENADSSAAAKGRDDDDKGNNAPNK